MSDLSPNETAITTNYDLFKTAINNHRCLDPTGHVLGRPHTFHQFLHWKLNSVERQFDRGPHLTHRLLNRNVPAARTERSNQRAVKRRGPPSPVIRQSLPAASVALRSGRWWHMKGRWWVTHRPEKFLWLFNEDASIGSDSGANEARRN